MGILETPPKQFSSPGLRRLVVRIGLAAEKQIEESLLKSPNRKLIAALADSQIFDEDFAIDEISKNLGISQIDLLQGNLWQNPFVVQSLHSLEPGFSLTHRVLPVKDEGDSVLVAMADPLDTEAISGVEFVLGKRAHIALTREKDVLALLNKLADSELLDEGGGESSALSLVGTEVDLVVEQEEDIDSSVKDGSESKPVIRLVNKMLADALEQNASDIHLEPTIDGMDVRFRIDGVMQSHLSIPKRMQGYVTTRFKILAAMDITERRRPQDGRFRISLGKHSGGDARVSTVPTPFGEKIVVRLLNTNLGTLSLDTLGFSEKVQQDFIKALSARDRMVVVTGPTGSGKSTTLYGAIQQVKEGSTNIITVEDPIEYRVAGITQIQVNQKVGMTFAKGLRSILRQDPDIIMVGEIRDLETAEVACQAAQTGHLVLSTLHTNTAASAVVRLKDLGLEPFLIASSLGAVLAQRLVRRLCESCAKPASDQEKEVLIKKYGVSTERCRVAVGCRQCERTGYRGRIGLYSLLLIDEELRELIRCEAGESEIEHLAQKKGLRTINQEASRLLAEGLTTRDEVERVLGQAEDKPDEGLVLPQGDETRTLDLSGLNDAEDLRSVFSDSSDELVFDEIVSDLPSGKATGSGTVAGLADNFREGESRARQKTLLIVDDDEGIRVVMSRIFKNEGYLVHQAFDALDAFAKLQQCEPDLVISDFIMPGFDGEEFVKRLRTNPKTAQTPIVMLTGSDSAEHEERARKAGVNEFLSKTLSPQVVLSRVRKLVGS